MKVQVYSGPKRIKILNFISIQKLNKNNTPKNFPANHNNMFVKKKVGLNLFIIKYADKTNSETQILYNYVYYLIEKLECKYFLL